MAQKEVGASCVPGFRDPDNIHVSHPVTPRGQGQPLQVINYATPAVTTCDAGNMNVQNQVLLAQSPSGSNGLQAPQVVVHSQAPAGVGQCPPGNPNFQTPPGNPPHAQVYIFDTRTFVNKENRTLGAIQIIIGLIHIFSGFNPYIYKNVIGQSGYLFWGGISYVVSGTLSVLAEKDTNTCMVNGSIGCNVVSAIFSLTGICILISDASIFLNSTSAISGCLIPFALLEFCLTCVVSHFGCQAVCWNHFWNFTETLANMINGTNTTTTGLAATSPEATDVTANPTKKATTPQTSDLTTPANLTRPSRTPRSTNPEPIYEGVNEESRKQ